MNIHFLQHVPFENGAYIELWATQHRHCVTYTQLFNNQTFPDLAAIDMLIILGGPMSVYDDDQYPWLAHEKAFIKKAIEQNVITMGICLGAQLICDVQGGVISKNKQPEIGWFPVKRTPDVAKSAVAAIMADTFPAFHWHHDTFSIPEGYIRLAESEACRNQAFMSMTGTVMGLQFHCEATKESVGNLVNNCYDHAVRGPFIQQKTNIIKQQKYYHASNQVMAVFLDYCLKKHNERVSPE